ncbi:MAG: hypothetical protein ABJN04_12590 [Hyphomicrobiales bacterium]
MKTEANKPTDSYSLSEWGMSGAKITISEDHFDALNEALTTLVSVSEIEEIFQVFAQSFIRFERDLLAIAFECSYESEESFDEEFFGSVRHRFNVNIITILTAWKSYDDQCNRILKRAINPPEAKEFNCKVRKEIFEAHRSYRICALLRDYAQHRALPLGSFSIGGAYNIDKDDAGFKSKADVGFNVSPYLDVLKFKNSSQCKDYLKKELDELGFEKIDIKWLIRSFAGAMYKRHSKLRTFLKPKIDEAGKQIADGYDFAGNAKDGKAVNLRLCGNGVERDMKENLAAIIQKSFKTRTSFERAERTYMTSRIEKDKQTYAGDVVTQRP